MSNNIFEEAIADAKKLREVAEDNAKKAILEAVTPKIREFIEGQLLEGNSIKNSIEENDSFNEEVVLDESSLSSLVNMLGGDTILNALEESKDTDTSDALFKSVNTAVSSLDDRQREKLLEIANKINQNIDNLSESNINNKDVRKREKTKMANKYYEVDLEALREEIQNELSNIEEEAELKPEDMYGEDMHAEDMHGEAEDFGLDEEINSMLAELKLVLDLGEDIEEDELPEDLRGLVEEEEAGDEEEDIEIGDEDELAGEEELEAPPADEEDFQIPLDETYDIDPNMLKQELLRIRKQIREGKMDHSFGGKGPKKLGVKKSFGGGSEGQDAFVNPPQLNKLNEALRKQRRQNRALNEKLNKYRGAVQTLREQLEDLNLFNAKLLYVNKLLQNKSLSESQKKSVIKALDEAKTLSEAKSLYSSLTETFSRGTKKTLSESRHMGSSSRTTSSAASTNKSSSEVSRWQMLAGL
jgi:hypothetical protein